MRKRASNIVLGRLGSTIDKAATGAASGAGMAGSLGSAANEARESTLNMDHAWLLENSDYYRLALSRIVNDPETQYLTATEQVEMAREETANYASSQVAMDPKAIAVSALAATGDTALFKAIGGKLTTNGIKAGAVKGAAMEGATEAIESGGQRYVNNEVSNEVLGTDIDPWQNVVSEGLEGGLIGSAIGGSVGAVSGGFSRQKPQEFPEKLDEPVPEAELTPEASSIPEEGNETQREPVVGNAVPKSPESSESPRSESSIQQDKEPPTYQPFSSAKPSDLVMDLQNAVSELKAQEEKDRNDRRASAVRQDLAKYVDALTQPDNQNPEVLETVRANAKQMVDSYWGIAPEPEQSSVTEQAQQAESPQGNFDFEAVAQNPETVEQDKTQLSEALQRGELGFVDEAAQQNAHQQKKADKKAELQKQGIYERVDQQPEEQTGVSTPYQPNSAMEDAFEKAQSTEDAAVLARKRELIAAHTQKALDRRADVIGSEAEKNELQSIMNAIQSEQELSKEDVNSLTNRLVTVQQGKFKPAQTASPVNPTKVNKKMGDFGEVLHGAKKHNWGKFGETIHSNIDKEQYGDKTLTQLLPKPNLKKLHEQGISKKQLALMGLIRASIPAKGSRKWGRKFESWKESVDMARSAYQMVLNSPGGDLDIGAFTPDTGRALVQQADDMSVEQIEQLSNLQVVKNPFNGLYRLGVKGIKINAVESSSLEELQKEVIPFIENVLQVRKEKSAAKKDTSKPMVNLAVFFDRHDRSRVKIATKVGSRVVDVQTGFTSTKEARAYLNEHREALEGKVVALRKEYKRELRTDENRLRQGKNGRTGDVTPDLFQNTFQFRGVQFGNWVEGKRRQKDLNNAYDSLADLARLIGVDTQALSLGGELGIAFGARGNGGRQPAAAHYEPGSVVINLTKKNGMGSLAHEWFHALDHYFGRQLPGGEWITENRKVENPAVREELAQAFIDLKTALDKTDMDKRSMERDKYQKDVYWNKTIEKMARAFEAWVIEQNNLQGVTNDYLANVISESDPVTDAYPYPTKAELDNGLSYAFSNLFEKMNAKVDEETGRTVLYSRHSFSENKLQHSIGKKQADVFIKGWLKRNQLEEVKVEVLGTQKEAEAITGEVIDGQVNAFYMNGKVHIVGENIENTKDLKRKLRHEVLTHYGLDKLMTENEAYELLNMVHQTKNSKHLRHIWDHVEENYSDESDYIKAEEAIAYANEHVDDSKVKAWLDKAIALVARMLRRVGLMGQGDFVEAELNDIARTISSKATSKPQWVPMQGELVSEPYVPDSESGNLAWQAMAMGYSRNHSNHFFGEGSYHNDLQKYLSTKISRPKPLKVMDTPKVLAALGVEGKDVVITRDKILKAINGVKHEVSLEVIEKLPELIADPVAVFAPDPATNKAQYENGDKNILIEAYENDKPVMIALRVNISEGRALSVHSIKSVYGRPANQYQRWINKDLLEYVKSKNPDWLRQRGLQLPKGGNQNRGSTNNILTGEDIVKMSAFGGNDSKPRYSKMTLDAALALDTPKERFNGVLNAISRGIKWAMESKAGGAIRGEIGLGAVTLRQLADLAKDKLPQLGQYVDTVHRMLTRRNQLAFDAHEMADGIRKWSARNRKHAEEMFDIAHLATVEGVDPEQPFKSAKEQIEKRIQHLEKVHDGSHKTNEQMVELKELRNLLKGEPRRQKKHAELKRRFDKLPKEAKQHYRNMRDKYKERHELYKHLLEQQIANAAIEGRIKKARIADLRSQFELQEVMAPYFPLSRFGDYWISVADENGERRFLMYETEREQQETRKKLEAQGFDVHSGYKLDKNPAVEGASLGFVVDLMSKVEESKLNEMKKSELKDTIYQMYLQTLPSRSMRKQFMHRQKTKGWSNDALRALAENMIKGSYQLARLEYADELTRLASDAAKTAGASGDNQASRYSNELMKRHEWVMNPKHSKVAQKITSLGFLYMLGFSPAAAAINTTQNFVVALPMIGSKFGFAAASRELGKATKDFIHAKGSIKTKLTELDELAAFDQWYDSGLLDATNAHDLAGMAEGQNWKYSPVAEKFSGWMSALFHKAEVFNRETTALASYRLARKNGMNHDEATKFAEKLTWDAHFDYTNVNRARYMQSPTMKVATQFKQYSQNMTYYLMRNAYLSMKGMTKQERWEARKQLVGTLGVTAMLAGTSALPLSLIYGIANGLNAVSGDGDEPYDAETEFKTYLADVFGSDMADKIIYGAGGAGISPRISLDGMWIRDANRDMEGEDTWSFYAQQAAGPVIGGILLQAIKSADKLADGDYYRGIEGVVPKAIKDGMKAYRYADEGALNSRGDAYREAEDFSMLDIGLQAIGMTPDELSRQYQLNNARKEYEQHVLDRRSNLMKAYYLAWKQGDTRLMLDTQKAISKFNRKYPKLALTSKKIRQSIKTRMRYSQQSSSGVNLNKNLRNFENSVGW